MVAAATPSAPPAANKATSAATPPARPRPTRATNATARSDLIRF